MIRPAAVVVRVLSIVPVAGSDTAVDPLDASTIVVPGQIHPIAMNFFDPSGVLIDSVRVERQANMARISLRSVCHCNPGLREVALGFCTQEMAAAFKDKEKTGCATMSCSM